jgi:signal transduction histidine kinase
MSMPNKRLSFGLTDPQEEGFRRSSLISDVRQAKIGILLFFIPAVAFIYNDYQFFGLSDEFYGLITLRAGFVIFSIGTVFLLSRTKDYRTYDRSIIAWETVAVVIVTIVDATRPGSFIAHVIFITIFVFIIYLVIPTRLVNQMFFAAMQTIGEVLIIVLAVSTTIQSLYTVYFSLVLANIIAFSSSWQFHAHRRQAYAAEESLRESRNRFHALFSSSNEGIALHELVNGDDGSVRDYRILDVNPAFGLTTSIPREKAIGALASELYGTGDPPYLDIYEKVAMSGEPTSFDTYFPPMNKHFRISVFSPGKGQFATVFVDITALKDLETQLKQRADELGRSNSDLQQFAYVSSHDLQEPLRMVVGYLSLLQKRYGDQLDSQAQHYIDNAITGGTRMRQLIDELLEYSRLDTSIKEFVPVNMNEVMETTIKMLDHSIQESKADIFVGPLPTIKADGSQMMQVMQNLVANAIKFHGPERPMVHVTAKKGPSEWTFSIKDNGIGLNVEYMDRIFQMFQRLHNREEYPGNGVGLAIAKKIIERHGGRIWVESEEGKGANFLFTVPLDG